MMHRTFNQRILGIALSSKGFGFAVFEGLDTFVNWGVKTATGEKNKQLSARVKELILAHHPTVVVIEDASTEDSRRAPRIRKLYKHIVALAPKHKVEVKTFARTEINRIFFGDEKGTRYERAEVVAGRFSEHVGLKLPPKRRTGDNESRTMEIFDALAIILAYRFWKAKRSTSQASEKRR